MTAHGVRAVADVRRFPASRRHPHFAGDALAGFLAAQDITYHWLPDLGGRRAASKESVNTGWRVAAFRGYADYMATPEFLAAYDRLRALAAERPTAIMCAESLWWQCHRRLIADQLVADGHSVVHIETAERASPHRLIDPARIVGGRLTYSADQPELDL